MDETRRKKKMELLQHAVDAQYMGETPVVSAI